MTLQQQYINLLYTFQCCLTNLGLDLNNMESINDDDNCISNLSSKINISLIILKTLKRQILLEDTCNTYCLTFEQIQILIEKLKNNCNDCCSDISFLESCIEV